MVKHIVFFNFHESSEGNSRLENAKIVKKELENLIDLIPCLKKIEVGINIPHAPQTDFDLCLYSEFDSFEDLDAYQIHPEHKRVGAFIGKVRSGRSAVDYVV